MKIRIKNNSIYISVAVIVAFGFWIRQIYNLPIDSRLASEAYNAFSIFKTGADINGEFLPIFLRGHNDFPGFLNVYLLSPFVGFLGLDDLSVFLATKISYFIFLGTFFYYLYLKRDLINCKEVFENKFFLLGLLLIFTFSPWGIFLSFYGLAESLGLTAFFCGLIFHEKFKSKTLLLFFFVLSFLTFPPLIVMEIIAILFLIDKGGKVKVLVGLIGLFLIFSINNHFRAYILENSFIKTLSPQQYSWQADRRLAYADTLDKTVKLGSINLNRIAQNKYFFAINNYFTDFARFFDFELISSPALTETVIEQDIQNYSGLPKIFYFEIILGFIGFLIVWAKRMKLGILVLGAILTIAIFIREVRLVNILLPLIGVLEAVAIYFLLSHKNRWLRLLSIAGVIVIWGLSLIYFYSIFYYYPEKWVSRNDMVNGVIWDYIKNRGLERFDKVLITDRWGDYTYYGLFYSKFDPASYQKLRQEAIKQGRYDSLDNIGKMYFGSFKYYEDPRAPKQVWAGLPGEFLGMYKDSNQELDLPNGLLMLKTSDFNTKDPYNGKNIWIVETRFDQEKEKPVVEEDI